MDSTSSSPLMTQDTSDFYETSNLTNSTDAPAIDDSEILLFINQFGYLITCIVGSIGNLLVIFTIWRVNRLHTVMYFVLANLGVADLLLCLFFVPFSLVELFNGERFIFGRAGCKIVFYVYQVSVTVSILNLTVVSIERFLAVRYPLKSRQYLTMGNAKLSTFIIWIFGIVYSTPILYGHDTYAHIRDGKEVENCYLLFKDWLHYQMWYLFFLFIPLFLIPLVIISSCYAAIIYTIFSRQMPGERQQHSMSNLKQDRTQGKKCEVDENTKKESSKKKQELKQLTIMLILVIVLFMICWSPYTFMLVLYSYQVFELTFKYEKIINLFYLFAIMNSAMNPLIYAFLSPTFRAASIWAVTSLFRRGKARQSQLTYATTMTGASRSVNYKDRNLKTVA